MKNNAEAADFVADYPNRQNYLGQSIDLTHDVIIGQVPLFLQWDKRWGYVSFGDSIIGLSGCGPTCLSMAYVYFTRDLNGTPREMASYCEKNGYYTESGTSWSLWTDGLSALGLSGEELSLSENSMKKPWIRASLSCAACDRGISPPPATISCSLIMMTRAFVSRIPTG